MPKDQIIMGAAVAAACGLGLWHGNWLIENTKKGRRLAGWLGESRAVWVLRGLFLAGMVFGVLLATDWIRPVKW